MDWDSVRADVYAPITGHFTPGRQGRRIRGVTVHHMAGNLSIEQCRSVWANNPTSAHYAVQADGRIGQMVDDADTAWACGNWDANLETISVEFANDRFGPWTVGAKALDAGAHLVAALCRCYGLGRPQWMDNVFPHRHWSPTQCPGELAGSQNAELMRLCGGWYDYMAGAASAPGGDDMLRDENLNKPGGGTVPADQALAWGYYYAKCAKEYLDEMSGQVEEMAKRMAAPVSPEAVAKALMENGGLKVDIDYEKLAKAVNDDAARRMAE